jgi:tetratricopeptide (TPR) repeat protein
MPPRGPTANESEARMDNDRWQRVDQLLQSALDTPAQERDAYLRRACGGDEGLEEEVRSLLAAHDRADGFLGAAAIDLAARGLAQHSSPDTGHNAGDRLIGHTFSHYRIVERIGAGGMGVLYKAEDTRLGRPVALKFVSDELSRNHEAIERFAREARLASSLNHPNICTIYDIGEQDGHSFIVMEFLDGTTLRDRLSAGALSMNAALDVGIQLAAALEAAHSAGIIHRDIKPANIFLGPRDHVKVLDFGLAKTGTATAHADVTTMAGTRQGVVMGTAAYMAPEQARGETVDHRADLWSVGLVLYEMVKGSRPAQAVRLRIEASPELERIVSKCLETDRELRYQHASELRTDLERLKRGSDSALTTAQAPAKARARWIGVAAAGVVVAVAVVGYVFYPRQASALTEKDTIVLAEFTNTTADSVFDDTLRQGLAAQIQQSPFLSLVSDERIRTTLPLMNQPTDARLTPEVARVLCVRTGGAAVLQGSIAALGSQYVLGLRATSCGTGDVLADEQAQASRKEDVLDALSQMVTRFRTRVGESLATVEEYSTPLQVTTPSLEAYQAYSAGMKAALAGSSVRALALFQRAVAIDPDFALAHAHIGFRYGGLGESALARQSLLKAYQLRDRASDAERLYIETLYHRDYTGNMEQERRILETWAAAYPRDPSAPTLLAGLALSSTGQYEAAIAETDKALAMEPDRAPAYANRANNQIRLNRLDDAMATVNRAAERKLESASLLLIPYFAAFLKGDEDGMASAAAAVRKGRGEEDNLSHLEGMVLARSGRLGDARRESEIAVDIAERANRTERAGLFEAGRAVWESFYGNVAAARQSAARAVELGRHGREVQYAAAFALAQVGDLPRTRTLADNLAGEFPEDTFVQYMYLPTLRALLALDVRDPKGAIQALQTASRYDLALGAVGYNGRFGGLYPIYVRGMAFLANGQPSEAVGEFQRILDHPGIVLVDPMGAMARLQLARALVLSGDHAKAKRAYDDLFAIWKNADPDVPVVKQARAEYARLP